MKNKLLIIGASGHGKVVADIALKMKKWKQIHFLDDDESVIESLGLKIIGKTSQAREHLADYEFFVAIGDNYIREKIQKRILSEGATVATLIHPSAIVNTEVKIGMGTVIMAGTIINSSTVIGSGCIVNTGSTIDHDNCIEDYVHISPGINLAGGVKVGQRTWLGIGCVVTNNIYITCNVIVGASATVVENIETPGTYIGIPARRIRK